jgi:hypothetical protein
MKPNFLKTPIFFATLCFFSVNTLLNNSYAQTNTNRYSCHTKNDEFSSLIAETKRGLIEILIWEGKYAKEHCAFVSERFQSFSDNGYLRFATSGYINGYPVICIKKTENENCTDPELVLIYLSPDENPEDFMNKLFDLNNRISGGGVSLSGDQPLDFLRFPHPTRTGAPDITEGAGTRAREEEQQR